MENLDPTDHKARKPKIDKYLSPTHPFSPRLFHLDMLLEKIIELATFENPIRKCSDTLTVRPVKQPFHRLTRAAYITLVNLIKGIIHLIPGRLASEGLLTH